MNKQILSMLVGAVVAVAGTSFYFTRNIDAMEQTLSNEAVRLVEQMKVTAKALSVAQPEPAVASVIKDCSVRPRYEELLVRLNALTPTELATIQSLHAECGDYYADMMAVMAMRLSDSFKQYEAIVGAQNELGMDTTAAQLEAWRSLTAKELARSELLTKQSDLQGAIINALNARDESTLTTLVTEAQNVTGSVEVLGIQLTTERSVVLQ